MDAGNSDPFEDWRNEGGAMLALLIDADCSKEPISAQLTHAGTCISEMRTLGKFAPLDDDTSYEMAALSLFLDVAIERVRDLEDAARSPSRRERRMTPIGALVARITRRASA